MQVGKWKMLGAGAIAMLIASSASASLIDLGGTDAVTGFNSVTKVLSSSSDGIPGTVVEPNSGAIFGANINFSIVLSGTEAGPVTVGTKFVGANVASADVWVTDPNTWEVLLAIEVNEIYVSNITFGPAGLFSTSMNFGGIDPEVAAGQSSVTITGGTLAGDFGGIGTEGLMFILLDSPSKAFGPWFVPGTGNFSTSFTAQTNTQFNFLPIPEPSTGLMLGGSLIALGIRRRCARASN